MGRGNLRKVRDGLGDSQDDLGRVGVFREGS